MDTYELNKIAGALLGSVLLVMGLGMLAEGLYYSPAPAVPGYPVELPDEEGHGGEAAEEEETVSLAALLAGGDAEKGAGQAKKCAACHTFDAGGDNKVGPNLHGIVGRAMATVDGFAYSDALQGLGGSWGYEELNAFIANPKGWLSGTTMVFAGIRRDDQRADLLRYLVEQSPDAPPLPVEEAAMEAPAEDAGAGTDAMETSSDAETPATDDSTMEAPASDSTDSPASEGETMDAPAESEDSTGTDSSN